MSSKPMLLSNCLVLAAQQAARATTGWHQSLRQFAPMGLLSAKVSSHAHCKIDLPFTAHARGVSTSDYENKGTYKDTSAKQIRQQLLEGALRHVPTHGWTQAALAAAAADLKLSPSVAGVLARREGELVEHFAAKCNKQLAAKLAELKATGELAQLRTRGTLSLAVKLRLQMITPFIDTWPQAIAVATQPRNAPHALALLGELMDEMWAAAGDTSTDFNWYTKRALLAGVYTSTELYMLTDFSPDYTDTWQALERRLDDALALGKAAGGMKASAQQWAQAAACAAQAAASAGPRTHSATASASSAAGAGAGGSGRGAQAQAGVGLTGVPGFQPQAPTPAPEGTGAGSSSVN